MITFLQPFLIFTITFLSLGLLISISNSFAIKRMGRYPRVEDQPFVSVLVPARNEELNIEKCVSSLLRQNYPNFEVIVLNDNSTDKTSLILKRLQQTNPRLQVINGNSLPEGWPGKHWACHQLSQAARGQYLLFTDADTVHAPNALQHAINALVNEKADLVTALPRQEVVSFGEKLVVPFMNFAILSFLPIHFGQKKQNPSLSVTIGQFMIFNRKAYDAIGGYASSIGNVNDDVLLGRHIIENGFKWCLLNGSDDVTCRMYHNFAEVFEGFSKNIFGFFNYRILPFTFTWLAVEFLFLEPYRVVIKYIAGVSTIQLVDYRLAVIIIFESFLLFYIAYHRMKIPHYLAFLYPLTIFLFTTVALFSMLYSLTGRASWKGRDLKKVDFRWL